MSRRLTIVLFLAVLIVSIISISSKMFGRPQRNTNSVPVPTQQINKDLEIVGATASFDEAMSLDQFEKIAPKLHLFAPALYHINDKGELGQLPVVYRDRFLQIARQNSLPIYPVIGDDFTDENVRKLLYNEAAQETFKKQLVEKASEEEFSGWTLDIESLQPSDLEAFSSLIEEVAEHLHSSGLKLTVVVFAKTGYKAGSAAQAQDYVFIGRHADYVGIMLFNFHNEETTAGAQTPLFWYRDVLNYATSTVPKEKIIISLNTHGYDWGSESVTEVTYPEVVSILASYQKPVLYDVAASSATFNYTKNGETHTVWFEDAKTIFDKMRIAQNEFDLSTFVLWRIGAEDGEIWKKLK